jgi:hypothetical protein
MPDLSVIEFSFEGANDCSSRFATLLSKGRLLVVTAPSDTRSLSVGIKENINGDLTVTARSGREIQTFEIPYRDAEPS